MTPVASVEEEGLADERRRDDEAAPKVDVIGLKTITSYLKSYLTATSSGSGALNETAIDLKIEQAMDLVKNHLLFAVREEIYSLKKQIVKLSERNRQLEEENEFLRNAALTEDVSVIQQQPFHS